MKRRNILKSVGTGVVGTAGLAATASAGEIDAATAEGALADHPGLLELLADDGVINSADTGEFSLETVAAPGVDRDGVARLDATLNGRETTMIVATKRVDRGWLTVHVLPALGTAFAMIRDGDRVADSYHADREIDDPVSGDCSLDCTLCWCGPYCGPGCCDDCVCLDPPLCGIEP